MSNEAQSVTGPRVQSRIKNYRNMTPVQRREALAKAALLDPQDQDLPGQPGILPIERANGMIENVVGTFELPLGIATNFTINGVDYLVPMAVEEASVVAAASFMARIARDCGGFMTSSTAPVMRAQVQVVDVKDPHAARLRILAARDELIALANSKDRVLVELGGGCKDIEVHVLSSARRGAMVVVHLVVDVRDAMGANAVNTMAEAVAPTVARLAQGKVLLRILSNLADLRLARATVTLTEESLATPGFTGREVIDGIMDAYELAVIDPYRATTHNKGIMNAIDPIVLATGNDWRAVEAGAHAWAARSGQYTSLSHWEIDAQGRLTGTLEMPMALGLVGGATRSHPMAQWALRVMKVQTASELGEVVCAVGLAQNMAALRALATEGIQRGHMSLHARNIALLVGAEGDEVDSVASTIVQWADVRADRAKEVLDKLRGATAAQSDQV